MPHGIHYLEELIRYPDLIIRKCPISRAIILHFETLTLYQNVSYKMSLRYRFNTIRHPYKRNDTPKKC